MKYPAALCIMCGTILISRTRHDFKQCRCSNETFIDGGSDYARYGGQDLHMVVTGQWNEDEKVFEEDEIYKGVLSENPNMPRQWTTNKNRTH